MQGAGGGGAGGGGTVTSVTGTAPVTSSGGATPAIGITGATGEQGNGTKVQMSTGTTTTNDLVKYDANGNAVDSGSAGTPTSTVVVTVANASSTGTTINTLAKLTGSPSTAVITSTTDTDNAIGVVTAGAGTTGNATIAVHGGTVSCVFDGGITAGDWVAQSTVTNGGCADAGSTRPVTQQVIGKVVSATNASAGTYSILIEVAPTRANLGAAATVTCGSHTFATTLGSASSTCTQPAPTDLTGITSTQGNGAKIQLSTGATVTNNLVKYDANGNAIDSGIATPAAAPVTSVTGTAPIVSGGGTTPAISLSGVTSEQGNGAKVQLATGTTTTNDLLKYDANGNAIDGGAIPAGTVTNVTGTAPITSTGGATPAIGLTTPLTAANGGTGTVFGTAAINELGAITTGNTATCNFTNTLICHFTASGAAPAITIANPTALPTNQLVHIGFTQSVAGYPTFTWGTVFQYYRSQTDAMAAMNGNVSASNFYTNSTTGIAWLAFWSDGTNLTLIGSGQDAEFHKITLNQLVVNSNANNPLGLNVTGGQHIVTSLANTGVAPTVTAGCNGAGLVQPAGQSTDNAGHFTTQTAAATTCTLTFHNAFANAPDCMFYDNSAAAVPIAYSTGAITTTTAIVDFASAAAKNIGYSCWGH